MLPTQEAAKEPAKKPLKVTFVVMVACMFCLSPLSISAAQNFFMHEFYNLQKACFDYCDAVYNHGSIVSLYIQSLLNITLVLYTAEFISQARMSVLP